VPAPIILGGPWAPRHATRGDLPDRLIDGQLRHLPNLPIFWAKTIHKNHPFGQNVAKKKDFG